MKRNPTKRVLSFVLALMLFAGSLPALPFKGEDGEENVALGAKVTAAVEDHNHRAANMTNGKSSTYWIGEYVPRYISFF